MSSPWEPRDVGLLTPETIVQLVKIKPSIKEFFGRSNENVLFAVERVGEFGQAAYSAPGWLSAQRAMPEDVAFEMSKKCGAKHYYVICNERLLFIGRFLKLSFQDALAPHLVSMPLRWIDVSNFIHPHDPVLCEYEKITPIFDAENVIEAATDFGRIKISWHALNGFTDRIRASLEAIQGFHGHDVAMKRGCLLLLVKALRASKPVERNNRVMQMLRHGFRPAAYRSWQGWIFVIADETLITCYEKERQITKCGYRFAEGERDR